MAFTPVLFFTNSGICQRVPSSKIFAVPEFSVGTGQTIVAGLEWNQIYDHKFGYAINTNYVMTKAPNLPGDYEGGFVIFGDKNETNEWGELNVRGIYSAKLGSSFNRLKLQAGPSFILGNESTFTPRNDPGIGSNYTVIKHNKFTVGASLVAGLDFPITRGVGVGVHATGNFNPLKSYLAGGISFQFGLMDVDMRKRR